MFFESYFKVSQANADERGEVKVCCPLPHYTSDGREYRDTNPSCSINLTKRVWHCASCGKGGKEQDLLQLIYGCTTPTAMKLKSMFDKNLYKQDYEPEAYTETQVQTAATLGMSEEALKSTGCTITGENESIEFMFPVFLSGSLVDIRHYRPFNREHKANGEVGAPTGLVIPSGITHEPDDKWLLLCAGEKDMTNARTQGFRAYTITGGEQKSPAMPWVFTNKKVAILYDNDSAGRSGAKMVARSIAEYAAEVRIVTNFTEVFPMPDSKEDLTDFFIKYGKTADDLKAYIGSTPPFINDDPMLNITHQNLEALATDSNFVGEIVKTDLMCVSVSDTPKDLPCTVRVKKCTDSQGKLTEGQEVLWSLDEHPESIFNIIGSEDKMKDVVKADLHLKAEKGLFIEIVERVNAYMGIVGSINEGIQNRVELPYIAIGCRPTQGKKYCATCVRTTDGTNMDACLVIDKLEDFNDSVETFEVTDDVKLSLSLLRRPTDDIDRRVQHRVEGVYGMLGYEADNTLIKFTDLVFNSCKAFDFLNFKNQRGYIDALVVGESRTGKSDTATHLRDAYDLGAFVSLAGSAATPVGIVGGSVKDIHGRLSTRAGVLPRCNGEVIVFEELAKADSNIVKSLTDIRSSGVARITRSTGMMEIPASLRMLTISNPRANEDGTSKPIDMYSDGIEIVKQLIGTAEDIARYDMVYVYPNPKRAKLVAELPDAYPEDVLRTAIRWVWSRKPDQIIWYEGADIYLAEQSEALDEKFPMHIKLFGTECWKKLARLSIAIAGYIINTDDDFENIYVTKDIVDYAIKFLTDLYDNDTFKLQDICAEYRKINEVTDVGITKLKEWYRDFGDAIEALAMDTEMHQADLAACVPQQNIMRFNAFLRIMQMHGFMTRYNQKLCATPKLIKTLNILKE